MRKITLTLPDGNKIEAAPGQKPSGDLPRGAAGAGPGRQAGQSAWCRSTWPPGQTPGWNG